MLKSQIKDFVTNGRKSSKRPCFGFIDKQLDAYIDWAFVRNYLILSSDENGINGIAVAYPLPKPFDNKINNLLPYDIEITEESTKELCILDWYAINTKGRISLVSQFMTRYPSWEAQDKYGIQVGVIKKIPNKYIKLLTLKY